MPITRKYTPLHKGKYHQPTAICGNVPSLKSLAPEAVSLKGLSVLLVEDDVFNQQLTGLILTRSGCNLAIAAHGREAVDIITRRRFDVVLMDICMPVMDGVQAARIIREELGLNTPIIAVTGDVLHEDLHRYRLAGINAHLAKPYNQRQLLSEIERWVNRA